LRRPGLPRRKLGFAHFGASRYDVDVTDDEDPAGKRAVRTMVEGAGELAGGRLGREVGSLGFHILTAMVESDRAPNAHTTWSPVVPSDLHLAKLPPLDEAGRGECRHCAQHFAFAELDLIDNAYTCRPCALARQPIAKQVDEVSLKPGVSPWTIAICAMGVVAVAVAILFAW
jgi:hypothetical protein